MLHDFLISHRILIVNNAKDRMRNRRKRIDDQEMSEGIRIFLEQFQAALLGNSTSSQDGKDESAHGQHGHDLLRMGFTIGQVVHDYGDICQAVTQVSTDMNAPVSGEEFRILNLCLDNAIAGAVTEYAFQVGERTHRENTENLGVFSHELRNLLSTAMLAFGAIREGRVATGGSTGMVLHRGLLGMRNLIDSSLANVRLEAGIGKFELVSAAELVEEVEISGLLQAQARDLIFTIGLVDREASVDGDRQILAAILSNLLQNAFKFTRKGSVDLSVRATDKHVFFDVRDECGGLPPGKAESLFVPYSQAGSDKSGLGLGLGICVKAARANGGEISVMDIPGCGCVFTLQLPRVYRPPLKAIPGGKSDRQESAVKVAEGGKILKARSI